MARTAYTTTSRPGLMSRLRARTAPRTSPRTHTTRSTRRGLGGGATTTTVTKTTRTTHHPAGVAATHHRRRPGIGDKISGALLKIKGSLTRRPGQKAAGTRRMRGTDGRRAHRHRRLFSSSSSSSLSDVNKVPSKKLSIASADEALNTAIDLVARVQNLQNRIVEVESLLESKEDEIVILTQDRDNWKQRAESILEVQSPILERQSTKKEELQPEKILPHPPQDETVTEMKPNDEQSQEQDTVYEVTVVTAQDTTKEPPGSSEMPSAVSSVDEALIEPQLERQNSATMNPETKDSPIEQSTNGQPIVEQQPVQPQTSEPNNLNTVTEPPLPQTTDDNSNLEAEKEYSNGGPSSRPPEP